MTTPKSKLYQYNYQSSLGYFVYRQVNEHMSLEAKFEHHDATFVLESAAKFYCDVRNHLVDMEGHDKLPDDISIVDYAVISFEWNTK